MARKYRNPSRFNYDRGDGLKVHRLNSGRKTGRHRYSFSMFDVDNIAMSTENGVLRVSVARELKRLNRLKCVRLNGYNGKLTGESDG